MKKRLHGKKAGIAILVALDIIADLYPTRRVVGINCLNLATFGGMPHCVTQQQSALASAKN